MKGERERERERERDQPTNSLSLSLALSPAYLLVVTTRVLAEALVLAVSDVALSALTLDLRQPNVPLRPRIHAGRLKA
jgi:hypothetical protein